MSAGRNMPKDDLPFCECRWLERAAHDPACPIEFDAELNEYNLRRANGGYMRLYHCPFCAGRAPVSLRSKLFATVTPEEALRLHQLTSDLRNEDEVRAKLGEPTHVREPGAVWMGKDEEDKPGEIRTAGTLIYKNQSETADICVTVGRYGRVHIHFTGKYLGRPPKVET